jgi:D-alanyl-D-alanine carboxypeptidase
MKRIFLSALVLVFALTFCRVEAAEIDYGASEIYSQADMDAAIKIIQKQFGKWKGCELHNIRYAGDEYNNAENLKWLNDLAPGKNYKSNFTQCIMFVSDFYVSSKATKTTFTLNHEYKDWQWWLARTDGGKWKLMTFGY